MTFLLAITDFSTGEGVYTADMVAALAPRLGFDCVAGWDRGLHGWPKRRGAYKGRKPSLSLYQAAQLRQRAQAGEKKTVLAQEFGVSRETLYSYLRARED